MAAVEPAKVAVVGPFTGPRAAWGELLTEGLAAVPFAAVRWQRYDDAGEAARALVVARRIVDTGGYAAVVGHFNSIGAARTLPVYQAAGLPVLLPLATAPELSAAGSDIAVQLCPNDDDQAAEVLRACRAAGRQRLITIHDGGDYGRALAQRIADGARGISVANAAGWAAAPRGAAVVLCGEHHRVAELVRHRPPGVGPVFVTDDCDVAEFTDLAGAPTDVQVLHLAGGPLARVVAAVAAVAAVLDKRPGVRGAALLAAVRGELPEPDEAAPPADTGWLVGPVRRRPEPGRYDVAVVGAGVVGRAAAATMAEAGLRVALLNGGPPGTSASGVSGALVRAFALDEVERELAVRSFHLLWGRASLARWYGFRRTGSLVLFGAADQDRAAAGVAEVRHAGVAAELLSTEEVARRWPRIDPTGLAGGVWEPDAGYASAPVTLAALLERARRAGVTVGEGWCARAPLADDGRVPLMGAPGTAEPAVVEADLVVVAAGCGAPELLSPWWPERRRARTKRIRYGIFDAAQARLPGLVDTTTGAWGRPDGAGGFLFGAPVPEWDVPVAAGAVLVPDQVAYLRQAAAGRLPFLSKAELWSGRYGTDLFVSGGPMLEPLPGMRRTITAAGWSGAGFKTAPAAAARVAAQIPTLLPRVPD